MCDVALLHCSAKFTRKKRTESVIYIKHTFFLTRSVLSIMLCKSSQKKHNQQREHFSVANISTLLQYCNSKTTVDFLNS